MPEEQFFSLLTTTGAAQLSNAVALAQTVDITEMAVGSGEADAYYTPTEAQTALETEVFRGAVNNKYVHADNANWVVFELAIPAVEGPFTVREAGIFDDAGNLIAIAKLPETYKPALAQGSAKDLLIKFVLQTSNAAQVELLVDPGVVLATHTKVAQDIALHEASADPHDQYNVPQATDAVVGKVELADVPESRAGSDTTRAVTPAGLGSAMAELSKSRLLDELKGVIGDGNAAQLVNAFADPYVNLNWIDAGASSDYSFDASSALIHNRSTTTVNSSAAEWTGSTGNFGFTGSTITMTAAPLVSIMSVDKLEGDFELSWTPVTANNHFNIGVFPFSDGGSFNQNSRTGGMDTMAASWYVSTQDHPSDGGDYSNAIFGAAQQFGTAPNLNVVHQLVRVGSTISYKINGGTVHTFAQQSNVDMSICFGSGSAPSVNVALVTWTMPGDPSDLILTSSQFSTLAVPSTGQFIGLVQPIDTVIYNTDLTLSMSRDDGATWDALVLEQLAQTTIPVLGTPTNVDVVFAEGALTGASLQQGRYRWNAFNNKEMNLHGAAPEFT